MSAPGQEPSAPTEPAAPSAPDAQTEVQTTAAPNEGLDRLFARMNEIAGQVTGVMDRVDGIQELVSPVEEEPEYYDDDGGLTEDGARQLIQQLVDERVHEQLAPREKARMVEMRDDAFEALRDEYPDLQDDAFANQLLADAIRWANAVNPDVIDRPEFVEIIEAFYKAEKYNTLAVQQAAEQPRPVVLESGTGAARQQRPNEPDWGSRIVQAAERLRPQI
jgi:hypothetical protein